MAIFDLFSKRQKKLRGDVIDVYYYDQLPNELRVQIIHIIRDAIGLDRTLSMYSMQSPYKPYKLIHETLCREYGVFTLSKNSYNKSDEDCVLDCLLETADVEKCIDIIELCFKYIENNITNNIDSYKQYFETKMEPKEAINELNYRLKESGFGYQYATEMIRVDSTYTHSEIAKPTISLLNKKKFIGANEEYLKAHEHYRHGRNKECLTECLKAFESTMKIICIEKG
jgi:hypothetical protein